MTLGAKLAKYLNLRLVVMALSLIAVLWLQASNLIDPFSVDEDFRSFYWMNKFQDPDLFPNDPYQGNGSINISMPWGDWPFYPASIGYGLLFYVANFFVPLLTISKLLPLILMPLTVWYLYEFGRTVRSSKMGATLAIGFVLLNLASPTSMSLLTGLQRSFAFTLIIALIYYLQRQSYIAAIIMIVLAALIYAPMFVLGSVIWGLAALKINREARLPLTFDKRALSTLLIAGFLSVLITIPTLLTLFPHLFSGSDAVAATGQASSSYQSLWANPHYQSDGRKALFLFFPFIGRVGLFDELMDGVHALLLVMIGLLIVLVRGCRAFDLPRIIYCVLWGSLIMFVLSWLAILLTNSFILYLPSRYTRLGLSLFLMMFVFFNSEDFLQEAALTMRRHQHKLIWLIVGVEVFIVGLIILYPSNKTGFLGFNLKWILAPTALIFGILGVIRFKNRFTTSPTPARLGQTAGGRMLMVIVAVIFLSGWLAYAPVMSQASFLDPEPAERALLKFLTTLPKDTLLAGTPCALDSVPLLAKRQVLFSCEQLNEDDALVLKALKAYYADDSQTVVDFCQEYGVNYLVVDERTYSEEYLSQDQLFFEPFNQELGTYIAGQNSFVLAQVPDTLKLFSSGDFFVIPCLDLD